MGKGLRHKAICFDCISVMLCPTSFTTRTRTQTPKRNWERERVRARDITLSKSLFIYHGLSVSKKHVQRILFQLRGPRTQRQLSNVDCHQLPRRFYSLDHKGKTFTKANAFTFRYQTVPDQVKGITCETLVGRNLMGKKKLSILSNRIINHSPTGVTPAQMERKHNLGC